MTDDIERLKLQLTRTTAQFADMQRQRDEARKALDAVLPFARAAHGYLMSRTCVQSERMCRHCDALALAPDYLKEQE